MKVTSNLLNHIFGTTTVKYMKITTVYYTIFSLTLSPPILALITFPLGLYNGKYYSKKEWSFSTSYSIAE